MAAARVAISWFVSPKIPNPSRYSSFPTPPSQSSSTFHSAVLSTARWVRPVRLTLFLIGFVSMLSLTRWWRRCRVGIRSFRSLPTSTTSDPMPTKGCQSLCLRICWFLQILVVDVSLKESYWPDIDVATSTSSFVFFCGMARFLQPSESVVMDCKPVLRGMMLQPMLLYWFLDFVSGRVSIAVFKSWYNEDVCSCPFHL